MRVKDFSPLQAGLEDFGRGGRFIHNSAFIIHGTGTYETNETNVTYRTGTWDWDNGTVTLGLVRLFCRKTIPKTNPKNCQFRTQKQSDMPFRGWSVEIDFWRGMKVKVFSPLQAGLEKFGLVGRGIPHSAFRIPHSAFRIPHSAFRIPHSAFRIPHSAFRIPHL